MYISKQIKKLGRAVREYQEIWKERKQAKDQSSYQILLSQYAEFYRKPVSDKTVLYESFGGRGLVGDPYAIFLELLGRREFSGLRHIWVIEDLEENRPVIDAYRDQKNVVFVEYQSKEYLEALTTAKYLVNNSTFQDFFAKRSEQVYLNTWHGTPVGMAGYQVPDGNFKVANVVRNFLSADYLLAADPRMVCMYLDDHKLKGIYPGEIIQEGCPRKDLIVKTASQTIKKKLGAYGIEIKDGRKIILYAPARDVKPMGSLDIQAKLKEALDGEKYQILIKPHWSMYRKLEDIGEYQGILVPAAIDDNELMHITDILISDHSSIFLDYMVLDRPILFYIPDIEGYQNERGRDIMPGELPGPVSSRLEDIVEEIKGIDDIWKEYRERYQAIKECMCPFEDGSASRRVVDAVFGRSGGYRRIYTEKTKETLLLHGGKIMENGISHSFLNLLGHLDYERFDVTVYVIEDPENPAMRQNINDIPERARVLVQTGTYAATVGEDTRRVFVTRRGMYRRTMRILYPLQVAKREFRRCFGDTEYDYIVNFGGYSSLNSIVLLQGPAKIRSIWMHSDMSADMEREVKGKKALHKALNFNISLYPQYDRLVSCGRSVMEVNRKNLATDKTYPKFMYAKNTVDEKRIRTGLGGSASVCLEGGQYGLQNVRELFSNRFSAQIFPLPDAGLINFVTMGRLSTEKNHIALIRAFSQLREDHPDTRLYILGDGPLREQEEQEIYVQGLEDRVFLPGNVKDPFAIMRRCQCFILPSFHEGQPMVLLEARALRMPVIVSDFSTVVDSLLPEGQLVIGTEEEEILEGMRAFMRGEVPAAYGFDVREYNREAYQEFERAVT